jgi:predicted MFS family arabinose efflux permease
MYTAAAAWLMTTLDANPLLVALVQVAATLPTFLFALPAGVIADIVDKRRLLLVTEIATMVLSAAFAALVTFGLVTPSLLLLFMFLTCAASALGAPAWQSIVPELVPKSDLPAAVAANSAGVNVSRAIGPALSGAVTVGLGTAAPFWLDAFSNLATIGALFWWRAPKRPRSRLPAERFASAIGTGIRFARNNPSLRATLIRAVGFFFFASAYWALLPLVARSQIAGGATLYGILLGAIGVAAVGATFALPWLKEKLEPDLLVAAGTVATAFAIIGFGVAHDALTALIASLIAGVSWIATLTTLNVSAQLALPDWVRGRGLSMYVTVMFGALTLGSALWGEIARVAGLPMACFLAAAGALFAIAATWRCKLHTSAGLDLTPSMHWPAPIVVREIPERAGPVMVSTEYRIAVTDRNPFLAELALLEAERRRDGAYAWGIFEDIAEPGRLVETFLVESWEEHLRQHERVTNADRAIQERIYQFLLQPAKVTHLVAAERGVEAPNV